MTDASLEAEPAAAKAWRKRMGLTMDQLSVLTGYSREAIYLMERGRNSLNKPHPPHAWRRYKLACLAVRIMQRMKIDSVNQWEWQ